MFQRVAYLIGHANLFNTISFTCTSTKSSKLDSYRSLYLIKMVYEVGFEPTQPEGKGFTVLSGSPTPALIRKINVEPGGLEPPTFCLQSRRSSQLSYDPIYGRPPRARTWNKRFKISCVTITPTVYTYII